MRPSYKERRISSRSTPLSEAGVKRADPDWIGLGWVFSRERVHKAQGLGPHFLQALSALVGTARQRPDVMPFFKQLNHRLAIGFAAGTWR